MKLSKEEQEVVDAAKQVMAIIKGVQEHIDGRNPVSIGGTMLTGIMGVMTGILNGNVICFRVGITALEYAYNHAEKAMEVSNAARKN